MLWIGPPVSVSCNKLWARTAVPIGRFDAGLWPAGPLDRAPSSKFASVDFYGHPSIRLCHEQAVQNLSRRKAGLEGGDARLPARRQDRRGGRERRGQIDAA